jgi:hypothetical protein
MEEFLKFLQYLSDALNSPRSVSIDGIAYILGLDDSIPQEVREEYTKSISETEGVSEVRNLSFSCKLNPEDKDIFNEEFSRITSKHNVTPNDLGIDLGEQGFCFVLKSDNIDHETMCEDLLGLMLKLSNDIRAFFISPGKYHRVFEIRGKKVYEIFVEEPVTHTATTPFTEPLNRKKIQEDDILDIKIALNHGEERDCLEVLEELMRLGS